MKKIVTILIALFILMEGVGWWVYRSSKKEDVVAANVSTQIVTPIQKKDNSVDQNDVANDNKYSSSDIISDGDAASFPPPSVETVNGVVQRTIHMGVRQWEWDPSQISVNYGEKVILIMHNADVPHSIMIPGLKVNVAIPEEGAIVTFMADKRGTFDFFCAVPCGSDHSKMQGKITVS